VGSRGVPGDDALGGVRRFEPQRLQVAHEESRHKETGGDDEQRFQCGESAAEGFHTWLYSTNYFVPQSI